MLMERHTYQSMEELGQQAKANLRLSAGSRETMADKLCESKGDDWDLGTTFADAEEMATVGWDEGQEQTLQILDGALKAVEKEMPQQTFDTIYDVSGGSVDVGVYLSGTPECMRRLRPVEVSKVGRVVVICASAHFSAGIRSSSVVRRGAAIVALAMTLDKLGHSTEIWADNTFSDYRGKSFNIRVRIKAADETPDPARLSFALGHPAYLRKLIFADRRTFSSGENMVMGAMPEPPVRDMPEGTIYFNEVRSPHDIPDADKFVIQTLKDIGLMEKES